MTTNPSGFERLQRLNERYRLSGFVVAGYSNESSVIGMTSSLRDAFESEQTTSEDMGTRLWPIHSRMDCPTREIDGAQKRIVPAAGPIQSSTRRRDMRVFPVPHAMIALQRSNSAHFSSIAATARS